MDSQMFLFFLTLTSSHSRARQWAMTSRPCPLPHLSVPFYSGSTLCPEWPVGGNAAALPVGSIIL